MQFVMMCATDGDRSVARTGFVGRTSFGSREPTGGALATNIFDFDIGVGRIGVRPTEGPSAVSAHGTDDFARRQSTLRGTFVVTARGGMMVASLFIDWLLHGPFQPLCEIARTVNDTHDRDAAFN